MTSASADPCYAIAAFGLGRVDPALPRAPMTTGSWNNLLARVKHERITGLLFEAIEEGSLETTTEQAEQAAVAHRASMASALLLELALTRVAQRLDDEAVEYRVLKGTAVAHLDYPDPSLRSFGDVDLLVRAEQFDATVAALRRDGHQRRFPEPRPGFDRRFGKGSCLVSPEGYEIDVHRTLAMGPFGMTIRVEDLWATSATFHLAGRPYLALGHEERFLHACVHSALGDAVPRLSALRDVAQMGLESSLDLDRALELAARWKAEAVVARAIGLAWDGLGLPVDRLVAWARAYSPRPAERRAIAVYADPAQTYAAKSFAAVWAIPRWRDRAAYLFTLAFPRRRYLRARQEGPLHRWHRGLEQVRRSLRR